jgi:serine/threonine protein kinase
MIKNIVRLREFIISVIWLGINYRTILNTINEKGLGKLKPYKFTLWTKKVSFFSCYDNQKGVFLKIYRKERCKNREIRVYEAMHNNDISNIAELFFYENTSVGNFIGFEMIDGTTLTEALFKLDLLNTISLLKQTISILDDLNKLQVVHCDIRPDNIIIDSAGKLKLIDFEFSVVKNIKDLAVITEIRGLRLNNLGGEHSVEGMKWDDAYSFYSIFREVIHGSNLIAEPAVEYEFELLKDRIGNNVYEHFS